MTAAQRTRLASLEKLYFVPGLSGDPPGHREYLWRGGGGRDGDDREGTPNLNHRKQPLLLKSNHLMFTHTYILLTALIFPKWSRVHAFATNVSYSVGHLTFSNTIPAHPQQLLISGESKAGISRVSRTNVDLPMQIVKKNWVLNESVTSQGSLFPGSNLERTASICA
jgi:hypothetical protein